MKILNKVICKTCLNWAITEYRQGCCGNWMVKENQDEEELEEEDPCICIPDEPNLMCESCF